MILSGQSLKFNSQLQARKQSVSRELIKLQENLISFAKTWLGNSWHTLIQVIPFLSRISRNVFTGFQSLDEVSQISD